jgi:toxin ParE1/3/4
MARVIVASGASADSAEILRYLDAEAGKAVALKFRELFSALYVHLAAFPGSGAARQNLGRGIRISVVSPYIVIYLHEEDKRVVTILRIVHGRRRITGAMLRRS